MEVDRPPLQFKKSKKLFFGWGTYHRDDFSWGGEGNLPGPIKCLTVKENHISSAVSVILRYRQTDKHTVTFIKDKEKVKNDLFTYIFTKKAVIKE